MGRHKQIYFDSEQQCEVKTCARCRTPKALSNFVLNKRTGYYSSQCNTCRKGDYRRHYQRNYRASVSEDGVPDTRRGMVFRAKHRANRLGILHDITYQDIALVDCCPVFGIKLEHTGALHTPASPSLDRVIPEQGYVRGNVRIISVRANCVKHDKSLAELEDAAEKLRQRLADTEAVIRYVKKHLASQTGEP